jgi:hypothetical protein
MFKGLFRRRLEKGFKTRLPERDQATDGEILGPVAEALDSALSSLQAERAGLSRRVEEAVVMASLSAGNESDEYISREPAQEAALRGYEDEMKRGRDRLAALDQHILNLRFLRAAFLTRFPGYNIKPVDKQPAA